MIKKQTITINGYPATFSFQTAAKFPPFDDSGWRGCKKRDSVLHRQLKKQNIPSPYHDYYDYVVEKVTKTEEGEIWQLGS